MKISLSPLPSKSTEPLSCTFPAKVKVFLLSVPLITSVSPLEPLRPPPFIIMFVPINFELSPIVTAVLYAFTIPFSKEEEPLTVTTPDFSPTPFIIVFVRFLLSNS